MISDRTVPNSQFASHPNSSTVEHFRELPLTRGYVAKVSPEDYDRVRDFPWFALITDGGNVYAAYKPSHSKKTYLLHRMILNAPGGVNVDHRPPRDKAVTAWAPGDDQ